MNNEPQTGMDFECSQLDPQKPKQNLYQITNDYASLMNEIELADGEITPEVATQLEITEKQLQSKSIAYLSIISKADAFVGQIDHEIKRLTALKKRNTNLVDNLKNNLLNAVIQFGEINVGFNKFSIRKSESVEVTDVNSLPTAFKTTKIVETADKVAIKKALKEGLKIEGCSIVSNDNLKIN